MVLRKAKEILPTMKVTPTSDEDLEFFETEGTIDKVKDISTKHGERAVVTIDNEKLKFDVFLNNFSMSNLIEKYGPDDTGWIDKKVKVVKEKNSKFGKEMIVLKAI
jgi:hypothetical protein